MKQLQIPNPKSQVNICCDCSSNPMAVSSSQTNVSCEFENNGAAIAVVDSGGQSPFSYSWNTTPVQTTQTAANLSAGNYGITVTDAGGCTASASITITANPTPTVTASSPATICIGNAAILTASGANTYSWSPFTGLNSTTGATVTANPTATITYTVTGTDANGCTNSASVTITVNPVSAPVADAGPDVEVVEPASCPGAPLFVQIGSPPIGINTYTWTSTPANYAPDGLNDIYASNPLLSYVPSIPPQTHSGTFTVTVTDPNTGCTNSDDLIASFVACRMGHFDTIPDANVNRYIEVYPNPANDFVDVKVELYNKEKALFEIYDILDRKLSASELTADDNDKTVSAIEMKGGVYFYKVSIDERIIKAGKLIIIR